MAERACASQRQERGWERASRGTPRKLQRPAVALSPSQAFAIHHFIIVAMAALRECNRLQPDTPLTGHSGAPRALSNVNKSIMAVERESAFPAYAMMIGGAFYFA